jgi:hypothetical protein
LAENGLIVMVLPEENSFALALWVSEQGLSTWLICSVLSKTKPKPLAKVRLIKRQ